MPHFPPLQRCAVVSVSHSFHPCIFVPPIPFSQFPPCIFDYAIVSCLAFLVDPMRMHSQLFTNRPLQSSRSLGPVCVYMSLLCPYNNFLTERRNYDLDICWSQGHHFRCVARFISNFHCRTRTAYVYNGCLAWYKFVNTHLYHSRQWFNMHLLTIYTAWETGRWWLCDRCVCWQWVNCFSNTLISSSCTVRSAPAVHKHRNYFLQVAPTYRHTARRHVVGLRRVKAADSAGLTNLGLFWSFKAHIVVYIHTTT